MGMNQVRVAMVGAGGFGYRHAKAYANDPRVIFTAVCGRTKERTQRRAQEFHVRDYTDIQEMMEKEKPDLVDVVTQEADQYRAVMDVLQSGYAKAVLTEKPLGTCVEEAYGMVREAQVRQVDFGVNFNRRFTVPYRLAKKWVEERAIGEPAYITYKFSHDPYDPPEEKDPYRWFFNVYPHAFDMLTYFAGPVDQVSAFFAKPEGHFYYKRFTINFRFLNRPVVANLIGGGEGKWRHESEYLEVGGTEGQAVVKNVTQMAVLRRHEEELEQVWTPAITEGPGLDIFEESVTNHLREAVTCLSEGRRMPAQAANALYVQILMQAAKESHERGGDPVRIDSFLGRYPLEGLRELTSVCAGSGMRHGQNIT